MRFNIERNRKITGLPLEFFLSMILLVSCGTTSTQSPEETGIVRGLVVVNQEVGSSSGDALGVPPKTWAAVNYSASFDRALSHANWSVIGTTERLGITGPDGQFEISDLEPGRYTLNLTKTLNGNLITITVPFTVGDIGAAEILVEMSWGLVRSIATYTHTGARMREIHGPYERWLITRDGRLSELGDPSRILTDLDGDGRFEKCETKVAGEECPAAEITGVTILGAPSQLVMGQRGRAFASARLSDGTEFDVTHLAEWQSSGPNVASVDSWGSVSALGVGVAALTATVGRVASLPWSIQVVERPTLRRIYVQNVSCIYPLGRPLDGALTASVLVEPLRDGSFRAPSCAQVVQIGGTIQFMALGEFDNGYYEDITDEVEWMVVPSERGDISDGLFTARQEGTASLTASIGHVVSDPTEIRVVTEPTVVAIDIYTTNWRLALVDTGTGGEATAMAECLGCGSLITVLRGDELQFKATARFDTGVWKDVSDEVTWRSSDPEITTINLGGVMTAVQEGEAVIDAILSDIISNPVSVRVVNEATLQFISIHQQGNDRVLEKGEQRFFRATGYYDLGFSRDLTDKLNWRSSDDSVGGFDAPGVFTGRAAGTVSVWAEHNGKQSDRLPLEVYETSDLDYCNPERINRAVWSDDFNRVILESDCAEYDQPGIVALRYTVTETQPRGGIFDPCLDLYVYQEKRRVRTIREEGCGDPFLPTSALGLAEAVLKYQLLAFWDLKDEVGNLVPPGVYTIYGRFYLYYDPVVSIKVTVR